MAWLSGWKHRKKITISGSSGAGTNYQVLLKVGESSGATGVHFHLDGKSENFPSGKNQSGDIRFTSSDGTTLLDFWVENVTGTSPNRVAYIWVEVADNLNTSKDIYIYIGNSSATNYSNGDNTFLFFDDFEGTSLDSNKWNTHLEWSSGSIVVSSDEVKLDSAQIISKNYQVNDGALEYRARATSGYEITSFARSNVNSGDALHNSGTQGYIASNFSGYQNSITVSGYPKANSANSINANTIYCFRFILQGVNLIGSRFSDNWTTLQVSTSYTDTGGRTSGYIGLRVDGSGNGNRVAYYDWIRVRKYVSPEPAFSSAGPIETFTPLSSRRLLLANW